MSCARPGSWRTTHRTRPLGVCRSSATTCITVGPGTAAPVLTWDVDVQRVATSIVLEMLNESPGPLLLPGTIGFWLRRG